MVRGPEAVRHAVPLGRVVVALRAQVLDVLLALEISGLRAALLHEAPQNLRILQHRARPQMIAVERLPLMIFLEKRALKHFQYGFILNIRIGKMYEHAGFRISIGINVEVMVSANVNVNVIKKGKLKKIRGVISSIPPHISKDTKLTFDDIVLDIGCDSKEEVEALGITIGTYVTPVPDFYLTENKTKMVNKAFDDRLGCALVLELVEEIQKIDHPNNIYLGGTVQEEVGLRGGQVSSQMIKPDLFITVDVSPTSDYLGKPEMGALGKGFLIRYYDPRNIMPIKLREYFIELSEKNNIPYQLFKSGGGTDAGAAQYAGDGILATTVGVPGRYIHSPATPRSTHEVLAHQLSTLSLDMDTPHRLSLDTHVSQGT